MAYVLSILCTIVLFSSLSIPSSAAQPSNKIIDLSIFDIISKTLLRTELKINELLELLKKIAIYHDRGPLHHKHGPPFQHSIQDNLISDDSEKLAGNEENQKMQKQKRPSVANNELSRDDSPTRKYYRPKYNNDYDYSDSNSNVNTNMNINTNSNRNTRKRPSFVDFLNDDK